MPAGNVDLDATSARVAEIHRPNLQDRSTQPRIFRGGPWPPFRLLKSSGGWLSECRRDKLLDSQTVRSLGRRQKRLNERPGSTNRHGGEALVPIPDGNLRVGIKPFSEGLQCLRVDISLSDSLNQMGEEWARNILALDFRPRSPRRIRSRSPPPACWPRRRFSHSRDDGQVCPTHPGTLVRR